MAMLMAAAVVVIVVQREHFFEAEAGGVDAVGREQMALDRLEARRPVAVDVPTSALAACSDASEHDATKAVLARAKTQERADRRFMGTQLQVNSA
jgi:hypothetical protein